MAFIIEIGFTSHQFYIRDFLSDFFEQRGVSANITQTQNAVVIEADESDPELEAALLGLEGALPYSLFMQASSHRFSETPFMLKAPQEQPKLLVNLGVCNSCKTQMFDPQSTSYYDPFTMCGHCGAQYAFFGRQLQKSLIFTIGDEAHRAEDAAGFSAVFERAASMVAAGKSLLMKTTFGWRRFSKERGEVLLCLNAEAMAAQLSLTKDEMLCFQSIEKPLLRVAVADEALKAVRGDTVRAKMPDEGFTVLLAAQLQALGCDFASYSEADALSEADGVLRFDQPIEVQRDMELFIYQQQRIVAAGERVSFPAWLPTHNDTLSVTDDLVALKAGNGHMVDRMAHFAQATASRLNLLEGCEEMLGHSNTHRFGRDHGELLCALASHGRVGKSAVGVCFEEASVRFDYYNGSHVTTVVPEIAFEAEKLIEKLSTLREGSDRLVQNLQTRYSTLYERLDTLEAGTPLFDVAAIAAGVEGEGFAALDRTAVRFMGKGGTQIDTNASGDSRFDPYLFLASILSYRFADVEPVMLSYSVFESLGDYFADILTQLQSKSKAEHVVLCGAQIAQSSLYSQVQQKMKNTGVLVNRSFPVGKEGAVVGGIYL